VQELFNKPLVEAIFELRWGLIGTDMISSMRDPGFKILLGRFYDKVKEKYPTIIELPSSQMPEEMMPYIVRHQFQTANDTWPLLQIGPGILSANDTSGYTWPRFKDNLSHALCAVYSSYPMDIHQFLPTQVALRYINAIPLDPSRVNLIDYLKQNLHTNIGLEASLSSTVLNIAQPSQLNLNLIFPMQSPSGECGISVSTGKNGDEQALIWQLDAQAVGAAVPSDQGFLLEWVETAHSVIETWFERLSEGELLSSFRG
jgi:uncharacterized protein (TIGR04255 family)